MPTIELKTEWNWNEKWQLNHSELDDTHREFVALMDAAMRAGDADLGPCIDKLVDHTKQHFEMEQRWMTETDFPPRDCHASEHHQVLETMEAVRARMAGGDAQMGRVLLTAIAQWFDGHADSMDRTLAAWMNATVRGPGPGGAACADDRGHDHQHDESCGHVHHHGESCAHGHPHDQL
jgi:hemerythrin